MDSLLSQFHLWLNIYCYLKCALHSHRENVNPKMEQPSFYFGELGQCEQQTCNSEIDIILRYQCVNINM